MEIKNQTKDLKIGLSEYKILEEGEGKFEAYVSIFNNVDYADEVIIKGAFAESLAKKLPKVVWSHNWEDIIGTVESAVEDERGLKVVCQLVLGVQKGREAYELLKAGAVDEFSIGYGVDEARYEEREGKTVRILTKISLFEISPVLAGCNPETELLGVKDLKSNEPKEIKEMTDEESCVKIVLSDDTVVKFNKNQIFDDYLASKTKELGVKVAENNKKIIILKNVYKKKINLESFIYKNIKDLDI